MKDDIKPSSEVILDAEVDVGGFTLGSTVNLFQLYPTTTMIPWKIERFNGAEYQEIEDVEEVFSVDFKTSGNLANKNINALNDIDVLLQKKLLELELLQSTIFIIDIPDVVYSPEDDSSNDWGFSGKGITLSDSEDNPEYSIQSQVKNQGKTLVITVNKVRETNNLQEQAVLSFRFIAICLNKNSGGELNKVYYSQDPRIGVRRVKL